MQIGTEDTEKALQGVPADAALAALDPDYELLLRLAESMGVRVSALVLGAEALRGGGGGE
jgi:hypothetical protein